MRIYTATKSESIEFNGITFRRYPNAKQWSHRVYFTPHAGHRRKGVGALHQEIWKSVNGPIPEGMQIHHIDGNPLNNAIENLACVQKDEHDREHHESRSARMRTPEGIAQIRSISGLASAWHGSAAGIEWHREAGRKSWQTKKISTVSCVHCGDSFETPFPTRAKFCSTRCRQRSYADDGRYATRARRRKAESRGIAGLQSYR